MTNPSPISLFRLLRTSALAALVFAGFAAEANPVKDVRLPRPARGAEAIELLGESLPKVAQAYGLEPHELMLRFRTQESLGVDAEGALTVVCDSVAASRARGLALGLKLENSDAITATSSTSTMLTGGSVDAFKLHSLPGASRVIYLDFDGQTTSNTSWNASYTGGAPIVSAPFDLDGDPSTFNSDERAAILAIWKRVSEDYAPFAVDVTTEDPGLEALRKSSSSDNVYGIRVVISPTNWYNGGAGGTAYIGSFSWDTDTPVWIFTGQLANYEKYIGEAVSHEVGHSLGLYHDGVGGTSPSEYYYGQGDWAPIMGVGYYAAITQFSKGDYANPTNTQDDFAVINGYIPYANDDHGNTTSTATTLAGPDVMGGGTIETRSDIDVFRFDSGAGAITLNIASPSNGTDLHAQVELLNSNGQVIVVNDPGSRSASFNVTLPSTGTYYLRISGVGYGDPKTTGYSDYGSVGNYVITGSLVPIAGLQSPVARVSVSTTSGTAPVTVNFSGLSSTDPDGTIVSYAWDFGNGSTATGATPSCTYQTAGTFIAVLTVTDNDGMTSTASVAISVAAAANLPPTAAASANVNSGLAPLPVAFSSNGSADPDGSIASYKWTFGDGTTSTAANPSKTYSAAGTYNATLTVTDNAGASATSTVAITVSSDPSSDIDVNSYTLTRASSNAGVSAVATIVVLNASNQPVANATVTIAWTGVVTGTTSAKTDASGKVQLSSGRSKKVGTITGTIKSVTPPTGITYRSGLFSAPDTLSITTK